MLMINEKKKNFFKSSYMLKIVYKYNIKLTLINHYFFEEKTLMKKNKLQNNNKSSVHWIIWKLLCMNGQLSLEET